MHSYYNQIKDILIKNEVTKQIKNYSINKSDLTSYYEVGKILIEAQGGEERAKYGNKLIKEYSSKLTNELGKGYSERSLKYMRKFYLYQKGQTVSAQLNWSIYVELLSIDDFNKLEYYENLVVNQNLSVRQLRERIKNKEYERLDDKTKEKLIKKEKTEVSDFIKDPIVIKNTLNYKDINEYALKKLILENLDDFLNELGDGFTYIGNEYKIKIGNNYNYIDLLLYNIEFNSYVVIELKVTKLKKEHLGQIETYMNYIDIHKKNINQGKTIGIIICKENNNYIMKYISDPRILSKSYKIVDIKKDNYQLSFI